MRLLRDQPNDAMYQKLFTQHDDTGTVKPHQAVTKKYTKYTKKAQIN